MFRVCAAHDVAVGIEGEFVRHVAADAGKVGNDAVVHEDVAAKNKRMRVYWCHSTAARGTDVGEDTLRLGVLAEGLEVEIVDGRGLRLVEGWSGSIDMLDVRRSSIGVPCVGFSVGLGELDRGRHSKPLYVHAIPKPSIFKREFRIRISSSGASWRSLSSLCGRSWGK